MSVFFRAVIAAVVFGSVSFAACRDELYAPIEKVAQHIYGGKPGEIARDSLIDSYLRASGAAFGYVRFPSNKNRTEFGPPKLVIRVSQKSLPLYREYFGRNPNVLEHFHWPYQDELEIRWLDDIYIKARKKRDWAFPVKTDEKTGETSPFYDTLGATIILSDSEALRLKDYFELNARVLNNPLISSRKPDKIPGYNYPMDPYIFNCTAWFGHIPIGDKLVRKVWVPGAVDRYGRGSEEPQSAFLHRYDPPESLDKISRELFLRVWSAPLHERLFDVLKIGLLPANHTNPGWVFLTLTGLVDNERVPFVVLYSEDHTAPIPKDFKPKMRLIGG